ncbi:MAG: flagellar biosynthesis repressor FlbT [Kordiimonas sp.]|nr:flagellar biosynthesis repressor FlbT [Kordiimonas sp.]|tara:strand:- start:859 stop:1284 length:426 start_codon:yes stop_codon:yes gene_type:complete
MALKLSLKPGEQFVVNGAVISNGDRRTTLVVQNKVSLLREKDILQEGQVTTPARRIYFPIMLMYMDGENLDKYHEEFLLRMTEFMSVIQNAEALANCVSISNDVMKGNYYHALMTCKKLFVFEEERLGYVPESLSADTEGE